MTFIALEGCDGTGKSSIAQSVVDELKRRLPDDEVEYKHFAQLKNDPFDEYALQFEDYRPGEGRHIVCDRLHWGETIYGPLYREKSALDTAGFRWVELFLKARGGTTWHVTAALDTVLERLATRGEDYLATHDVQHVWEGFQDVSEKAATLGGVADTTDRTAEDIAEQIVTEAIYSEEQASRMFHPEYIGRDYPNVLLVGDQQGSIAPGITAAPFMPRGASSGRFLLESLPELWWNGVGVVNAQETDLGTLINLLGGPIVVALGRNASDELLDQDIEHAAVPHPSFVRRFHNKKMREYGALIREVSQTGDVKLSWPK